MYENETKPQRALLVSVDTGEYDAESSLNELEELCRTAGAEPALTVVQKRPAPDTATCIGSGMVEQVAESCRQEDVDLLVFDRELSPTQIRNLEKACGVRVIDRTTLILDIFAQRGPQQRGQAAGGTCPAAVPAAQAFRPGHGAVPAGRRHRHPGPRRNQAGNRPAAYPAADQLL